MSGIFQNIHKLIQSAFCTGSAHVKTDACFVIVKIKGREQINNPNFSFPPEIPDIVTFPGFLHVFFFSSSSVAISQTKWKVGKK